MASGKSGFECGMVLATEVEILVELPFTPRAVELVNETAVDTFHWNDPMAPNTGHLMTNGTPPVHTFVTAANAGVKPLVKRELDVDSPDSVRGFAIGQDCVLNSADEVIYWKAWA